ncbi:MAG: DUF1566 domain-containing protein, partial [Gammaproteobacteria bacterium]|nr:DUF1566 domain-containing protein [Gammaproteobacteria bacterium]
LCGLTNWRLPLREELRSIVHYGSITGTTIDSNYFPNTSNSDTWTSQTSLYRNTDGSEAWEIHFNTGYSESHEKTEENVHIRLVHNPLN